MHEITFTKEEYNVLFFCFLMLHVTHIADIGRSSGVFYFLPERN